jgi:hypothetical protein
MSYMSQEPQAAAVTPTALVEANQFDVSGPISISYVRSSITGSPLLAYKDAELDLNFSDAEVQQAPGPQGESSPQGEFVTVRLVHAVDVFVRTFTLLVPKITLSSGDQVEFETLGLETTDRAAAHVAAPGPSGVLQTYRVHQLRGVAQHIVA